ncbi:MAG: hypothetical protein RLZZ511_4447 [Cyanobacteriota bacterium]|jgi:hypothetical protein
MPGQSTSKSMTFEEYLDIFWEVSDNESLAEPEREAAMAQRLNDAGVSQADQDRLAKELVMSFNNPQPAQAEMTLTDYTRAWASVGRDNSIPLAEKQAHLDQLIAGWGVPDAHVAKLKQQFVVARAK